PTLYHVVNNLQISLFFSGRQTSASESVSKQMTIYVGTSGFAYKEWKGNFYPSDLPAAKMLRYYAERFRAVEINNTFYRMTTAAALSAWASQVSADFKFIIKAPRRITHFKRL